MSSGFALDVPDFSTSEAGNPFVEGFYADPDSQFYEGQYWVYPTSSYPYDQQTYFDCFSSAGLVHWTKHPNILVAKDFPWAHRAIWAPAPISRNGKYYLYFGANDIQTNDELGGIGVGVADRPEGPYKDPLGGPLIGKYYNGAQPIDQAAFIDDDGQAYIYYGGHSHANVAKLNKDMTSIGTFDDGTTFKEITPDNYVEGILMKKINGRYYLFWSEGGWGGPDYAVSYAIADSPIGPFKRLDKILQQDPAVATGSGHNGIVHVPDTDIYYIVYHRHPLNSTGAEDRHLAYDRLYFNEDGTIKPVTMLVHDNFNDGNMIGWTTYGGSWSTKHNNLHAGSSAGGKALLKTDFADLEFTADVTIPTANAGDAGLVFRVSNPSEGVDSYDGYYAGISTAGNLALGSSTSGQWKVLGTLAAKFRPGQTYHLKVTAKGASIAVHAAGEDVNAQIAIVDDTHGHGMDGVRVFQTEAIFDNVKLSHL